jgi:hypothetical protein
VQTWVEKLKSVHYSDYMINALKKYNFWDRDVKDTGIKRQKFLGYLDISTIV